MFCPKCGQWNAGSATQCTACGTSLLPPSLGNASAPPAPAPADPAAAPRPQMPPEYGSAPSPYPAAMSPQTAYPPYPPQGAPSPQPAPPNGPNYPQPSYPAYPQQAYPSAPVASGSAPPAYPSYSPLPSYSPMPPGTPYAGAPSYGAGYPAQAQHTLNQCKVCGAMIPHGALSCSICLVPLGMIANPYDPTVTTYLDARALNQPGTSPVYAAPGAYAGRASNPSNSVPEGARAGWNWGAALNSTLWAFTHRSIGWGLLCGTGLFLWVMMIIGMSTMSASDRHSGADDTESAVFGILFVGGIALFWLIKTLYLGFKGNEIAWRSGRYANVSQMRNAQQQWGPWSIVVFLIASAVLISATVIAGGH